MGIPIVISSLSLLSASLGVPGPFNNSPWTKIAALYLALVRVRTLHLSKATRHGGRRLVMTCVFPQFTHVRFVCGPWA